MGEEKKLKILIDTDLGDDVDDAAALIMALNSPELEITGITTVYQNTEKRAEMVLDLCHLYDREDIPVYTGSSRAIIQETDEDATPLQYEILRADYRNKIRCECSAAEFIVQQLRSDPEIIILEMGMMTNLAIAFLLAPEVMKPARIIGMGGLFANLSPEWNIACDPEAARIVMDYAQRLELFGLDVTRDFKVAREELDQWSAPDNEHLQYYRKGVDLFLKKTGYPITLHDTVLIAYLLDPQIAEMKRCDYSVELQGEFTRGSIVRKMNGYALDCERRKEFYYAENIHLGRFFELVKARIY